MYFLIIWQGENIDYKIGKNVEESKQLLVKLEKSKGKKAKPKKGGQRGKVKKGDSDDDVYEDEPMMAAMNWHISWVFAA